MALPSFMQRSATLQIKTIEMHTTGEPTRIVYSGFQDLPGTLLEQRALAQSKYDHIRRALVSEPRGHRDMYGAILCPRTELTETGEASIGVIFLTNEGYSTMCGHATLALGRLLVDYAAAKDSGLGTLEAAKKIRLDYGKKAAYVSIHAPCGLVNVTVPIKETSDDSWAADPAQHVSYRSVPSYATGLSVQMDIPAEFAWPELANLDSNNRIVFDVGYGGAFYIVVPATSLGFKSIRSAGFKALSNATAKVKAAFNATESAHLQKQYLRHPNHRDLEFLYGLIVTEPNSEEEDDGENGLCFFADGQVDRSPTGSGVQARVAIAHAKGDRKLHEPFIYHSPVSKANRGQGAFTGEAVEEVDIGNNLSGVIVKVSGSAKYVGCCNFMMEADDEIGNGFWFEDIMNG